MSGGPFFPSSIYIGGASGNLFPNFYVGAGGNAANTEEGPIGVVASLASDVVAHLRFIMPPSIPTGTLKLRLLALANATSGVAKITVSDGVATPAASPAASGNPSAVALTSEAQTTITWAASENDRYKEAKITLTAAPAGNDVVVIAITFNGSGGVWTLAQVATFIAALIFE